jgi:hypothetical protein
VCDSFYYSSTDFHEFAYIQGSGKTTLLKAIVNKCKPSTATYDDAVSDFDLQEVIADGLCYCDSAGINMQVFSFSPCFPLFFYCFSLQSGMCFIKLVIRTQNKILFLGTKNLFNPKYIVMFIRFFI